MGRVLSCATPAGTTGVVTLATLFRTEKSGTGPLAREVAVIGPLAGALTTIVALKLVPGASVGGLQKTGPSPTHPLSELAKVTLAPGGGVNSSVPVPASSPLLRSTSR